MLVLKRKEFSGMAQVGNIKSSWKPLASKKVATSVNNGSFPSVGVKLQRSMQKNPLAGKNITNIHGVNDSINAKQMALTTREGRGLAKDMGGQQRLNKIIMKQAHGGY